MPTANVEDTDHRRRVELSSGITISGALSIIKLLLMLAPFVIAGGCGNQPATYTGFDVIYSGVFLPPLFILLIVPVSAIAAISLIIIHAVEPSDRIRRDAKWSLAFSAVSLAALFIVAVCIAWFDPKPSPEFLWGFWGMVTLDVLTIILLLTLIIRHHGRET